MVKQRQCVLIFQIVPNCKTPNTYHLFFFEKRSTILKYKLLFKTITRSLACLRYFCKKLRQSIEISCTVTISVHFNFLVTLLHIFKNSKTLIQIYRITHSENGCVEYVETYEYLHVWQFAYMKIRILRNLKHF